jgi:hypothetical protein
MMQPWQLTPEEIATVGAARQTSERNGLTIGKTARLIVFDEVDKFPVSQALSANRCDLAIGPVEQAAEFYAFVTGTAQPLDGQTFDAPCPQHVAVSIDSDGESMGAMIASIASLLKHIPESFIDPFELATYARVIQTEGRDTATPEACAVRLHFEPTDRIRELVATVLARQLDPDLVAVESHGWPILSIGDSNTPVVGSTGQGAISAPDGPPA